MNQLEGKHKLPLIETRVIKNEISKIKSKQPIRYIQLAVTEIIIKACFKAGIDTPLELYVSDDRIIEPHGQQVIAKLKGNLIYQKIKFLIRPDYSISITDQNLDKSFVLYWKLSGIKMKKGSKVLTARCKNAYILSTKHEVNIKPKIEGLTVEKLFTEVVKPLEDDKLITFNDIEEDNEELSIISQRFNNHEIGESSKGKEVIKTAVNIGQYHILGKIKRTGKEIPILIDTGSSINFININLINQEKIKNSELQYLTIDGKLLNSLGKIYEILIIGTQEIGIEFEIFEDKANQVLLGTKWLDTVNPWSLGNDRFKFTYKNVKFETDRLRGNYNTLNQEYDIR